MDKCFDRTRADLKPVRHLFIGGRSSTVDRVQKNFQVPTLLSTMHLYPIDGAAARVGRNQTAFSYREAQYSMVICGIDPDPANAELITKWTRDYWAAIEPHSLGGAYVNFLMEDEGVGRVKAAYRDNFERLVEIKTKYDPGNFFSRNQNIRPQPPGEKAAGRRR
jgi:hypothetical protein